MITNANSNTSKNLTRMLPVEIDTTIYYRVGSDINRGASRQLIMHIRQLEAEEACLADRTTNNIRLFSIGTLTLRGVQILRNLNPVDLEAGLRDNYISTASVIDGFYGRKIPPEYQVIKTTQYHVLSNQYQVPSLSCVTPSTTPITHMSQDQNLAL